MCVLFRVVSVYQVQDSLERFVKSAPEGLKRSAVALGKTVVPIAKVFIPRPLPDTTASPPPQFSLVCLNFCVGRPVYLSVGLSFCLSL